MYHEHPVFQELVSELTTFFNIHITVDRKKVVMVEMHESAVTRG